MAVRGGFGISDSHYTRAEFYNVLNKTNLFLPSAALSGAAGGNATGGGLITSTYTPRVIHFALKLVY